MRNLRVELPPNSAVGNPYFVNAPAQAITSSQLLAALGGTLLTNQVLPTVVDLDNLPPQTLVGNPTAASGVPLAFVTFSTFNSLLSQSLPQATYKSFDPDSVPPYTIIGNSASTPQLAVPIPISKVFPPANAGRLMVIIYSQNIIYFH